MQKKELVAIIAEENSLPQTEVAAVVESFMKTVTKVCNNNERIDLRGFGSFMLKTKAARVGRNPKTGKTVPIPSKSVLFFKVSHNLNTGE